MNMPMIVNCKTVTKIYLTTMKVLIGLIPHDRPKNEFKNSDNIKRRGSQTRFVEPVKYNESKICLNKIIISRKENEDVCTRTWLSLNTVPIADFNPSFKFPIPNLFTKLTV